MDSIDELRKKEMEYKKVRDLAKKQPVNKCSYCCGVAVVVEDWGDEKTFSCADCSAPGVGTPLTEAGGADRE